MKRALVLAGLLTAAAVACGQETGSIRGEVKDPTGAAVAAAAVTARGPALQGEKTALSEPTGSFLVLGLPPGLYSVSVQAAGFATFMQEGILVRAGQTITLETRLELRTVSTEVTVHAAAEVPIVDTTAGVERFNVSGDFVRELPLSMRQNWDSVWFLIPAAVTIGQSGGPDVNVDPGIHGASSRANIYRLDNFEIGNAFTNQGWTTQFSTEAIQDITIVTAGPDASQPLGTGGYINVVTKSGGNHFHGSAAMYMQPSPWNWNNVPGGKPPDQQLYQPDLSLGGPIRKDKTWFFASYRRVFLNQGVPRSANQIATFNQYSIAVPNYDYLERDTRLNVKVTHQLVSKHQLIASFMDDHTQIYNSDSRDQSTRLAAIGIGGPGGPTGTMTWVATWSPTFVTSSTYGFRSQVNTTSLNGGNSPATVLYAGTTISRGVPTGQTVVLYDGNRGGGAWYSAGNRDHHEITSDATLLRRGIAGEHTFRWGFQWKPASVAFWNNNFNTPYFIEFVAVKQSDGTYKNVPFHQQSLNPTQVLGFGNQTKQMGGYVMDKWSPFGRLSLNLGVRFDRQVSEDAFGIHDMDAVSTDPRFGAAFRITKSGRDVLRFSWARIHDVIYDQAAPSYVSTKSSDTTDQYSTQIDGVFDLTQVTPGTIRNAPPPELRDPNVHAGHQDQLHVSYTRELPGRILLDVGYLHSVLQDQLTSYNANLLIQNNVFVGVKNPNFGSLNVYTNATWQHYVYNDVEISAVRNVGGKLDMFASYAYQKQRLVGTWAPDNPNWYFGYPASWFEDPNQQRPHILHLNADYRLPWKFTVSAIFVGLSGGYSGAITHTLTANDPEVLAHGPQRITTSAGIVVNNPLFTQTRLAQPTSQGQFELPFLKRLNVRFGKEFRIRESHTLGAYIDFENLTNDGSPLFFINGASRIDNAPGVPNPLYGQFGSAVQSPRGAQISVRYSF